MGRRAGPPPLLGGNSRAGRPWPGWEAGGPPSLFPSHKVQRRTEADRSPQSEGGREVSSQPECLGYKPSLRLSPGPPTLRSCPLAWQLIKRRLPWAQNGLLLGRLRQGPRSPRQGTGGGAAKGQWLEQLHPCPPLSTQHSPSPASPQPLSPRRYTWVLHGARLPGDSECPPGPRGSRLQCKRLQAETHSQRGMHTWPEPHFHPRPTPWPASRVPTSPLSSGCLEVLDQPQPH